MAGRDNNSGMRSVPSTPPPTLVGLSSLHSGAGPFQAPSLPSTAPTSLTDLSSPPAYPGDRNTSPFRTHPVYSLEVLNIEVEGVLLQLPKVPFLEYSDTFAEQHGIQTGGGNNQKPVKLDVGLEEFESFLSAFLSRSVYLCPTFTVASLTQSLMYTN
ncbi:hypothetical protein CC1G_14440 [Coprinopsis cinerea okayama7|uniref:Uncharacterized protein n=1 Tax=Coprinopsis cinerea (strain Okayama-7 / 130 / ATCC MYA-4618 / FGSC 9003) TaxID=240176 RepID=D6RLT5_COPC7|nr:hypothetical protein CC1G_14440 [Coprinopsis cinerea okayama7\|eukprot:XP_002911443.1 hypothetical protein CC1G_14440 [Coprinopsis cinerea okayama7\